jgi:hypothetical protein
VKDAQGSDHLIDVDDGVAALGEDLSDRQAVHLIAVLDSFAQSDTPPDVAINDASDDVDAIGIQSRENFFSIRREIGHLLCGEGLLHSSFEAILEGTRNCLNHICR